jgi:hypothetical protein
MDASLKELKKLSKDFRDYFRPIMEIVDAQENLAVQTGYHSKWHEPAETLRKPA